MSAAHTDLNGQGCTSFAPIPLSAPYPIHSADFAQTTLTPGVPLSQNERGEKVPSSPSPSVGEGVRRGLRPATRGGKAPSSGSFRLFCVMDSRSGEGLLGQCVGLKSLRFLWEKGFRHEGKRCVSQPGRRPVQRGSGESECRPRLGL